MIIVTGATKGIGLAICELLAQQGQALLAIARTQSDLTAMRQNWQQRFPSCTLHTLASDLSTAEGCQAVGDFLEQQALTPSVLINNAGFFEPGGILVEDEVLENLLALNLYAAHRLSRLIVPRMLASGQGHIVNIGSLASLDFPSHMLAYSVSKYAFEGWHKALSIELQATKLRTSFLVPGPTLTASWAEVEDKPAEMLSPEQVAKAVAYLLDVSTNGHIPELIIRP